MLIFECCRDFWKGTWRKCFCLSPRQNLPFNIIEVFDLFWSNSSHCPTTRDEFSVSLESSILISFWTIQIFDTYSLYFQHISKDEGLLDSLNLKLLMIQGFHLSLLLEISLVAHFFPLASRTCSVLNPTGKVHIGCCPHSNGCSDALRNPL